MKQPNLGYGDVKLDFACMQGCDYNDLCGQTSADLFQLSCTVFEKKNIFDLTPNFLAFTIPILGRYIMGRKKVSNNTLYVYTKISMGSLRILADTV